MARYNNVIAAPRDVLGSLAGVELREMERSGKNSFCCGAGGGRMWMEETRGTRINVERTRQALATGAEVVATNCPFCMTMMKDGLAEAESNAAGTVSAADIAELLADSLVPAVPAGPPPAGAPVGAEGGSTMSELRPYRLSAEQLELRDAVRTVARERIAPRAAEVDRLAEFPWDNKELLASQDILALPFPERYGGLGADLLTVCLAIEALSAACATTGLILAVHELASLPIISKGTDEQRQRWLPDLAAGRTLISFAITESGAGSDAGSIAMRATRDGDDYVLDGAKRFITQGSVADLVVVFAVSDPGAKRHRNLSCFVVETNRPGFSVGRLEHKMGIRGSPTAELLFDAVRVPAGQPDRCRR